MLSSLLTAAQLSDLNLAARPHVRAGRSATIADLIAGGAGDIVLAQAATRTVERLREAHAALGADRLEVALGTLTQASLRCVLARLDAGRPTSRMRKPELLCVLGEIAQGCNTFAEADAIQFGPIGAVRFPALTEADLRAAFAPAA